MGVPNIVDSSNAGELVAGAGTGSHQAGGRRASIWPPILQLTFGIGALVAAFIGLWHNRMTYFRFVNNSDLLYLVTLYGDLFHRQYTMQGWSPSSVPFFFPDMPAFFAAMALTADSASAFCIFAGFMWVGFLGCLYWIGGFFTPSRPPRVLAVGLAAMGIFVLTCIKDSSYWITFRWYLAPNAHGGGALAGLVLLVLGLSLLNRPGVVRFVLFAAISFLAIMSDFIVLPHYLIPLVAGGLLQLIQRRAKIWVVLLMAGIVAGAAYSAAPCTEWFMKCAVMEYHKFDMHPAKGTDFTENLARFRADMPAIMGPTTPLSVLLVTSILVAGVTVVVARRTTAGSRLLVLGVITVASCTGAIIMPIRYPVWANNDCTRYLLPMLTLPLALLIASALTLRQRVSPWGWTLAAVPLLIGLAVAAGPVFKGERVKNRYAFYTGEIAFLDSVARKHKLHYGYGTYWQARKFTLASREHLIVSEIEPIDGELTPDWWMDNPHRWAQRPKKQGGQFPIYDFYIASGQTEKIVRDACGPPAAVESGIQDGGRLTVLIYNRPQDVVFRNICRARASLACRIPSRRIVMPRTLDCPRSEGMPWDRHGAIQMHPNEEVVVHVRGAGGGDFMDISTDQPNTYELKFMQRNEFVASYRLESAPLHWLHSRGISLVPIVGDKPFDTIRIRALTDSQMPTIGHLFIYDDPVLHPDDSR